MEGKGVESDSELPRNRGSQGHQEDGRNQQGQIISCEESFPTYHFVSDDVLVIQYQTQFLPRMALGGNILPGLNPGSLALTP